MVPYIFLLLLFQKAISFTQDFKISKELEVNVPKFLMKSAEFISQSTRQNFQDCDLVFVHDGGPDNNRDVSLVLVQLLNNLSLSIIGGSFIINVGNNSTTLTSFKNFHTRSEWQGCSTVVLLINDIRKMYGEELDVYQHLFNQITPLYGPITRKDEDHFFLIIESGSERETEEFLLSPKFGNKIKYKIGLVKDRTQDKLLSFKTADFYRNHGSPVIVTLDLNFESLKSQIFPDFTKNHHGRVLKISCAVVPFRLEIEESSPGSDFFRMKRGFYKYWVDMALSKFNFTYSIFYSSMGRGTGALLKNGTWTGGLGDVLYERAEMGVLVGHIYSRHKFVEWSAPLSYEWMVFVCHNPRTHFSPMAIFWPFPKLVWGLFLVSICANVVFLKTLISVRIEGGGALWSIQKISLYLYSSLLEQDSFNPGNIVAHPIRLFCSFWLIFALIISCAYRAKLVSVIAFPISTFVPETFEALSYSDFRPGLNTIGRGDAAYIRFSTTPSPVFQKMFKKMEITPNGLECLKKTVKEDICFIIWAGIAEYESMKNISDKFGRSPLQFSTDTTYFIEDGMVWSKRAIFRKHFDLTIWNVGSMGLNTQWHKMDMDNVRRSRNAWEKENNIPERIFGEEGPQKLKIVHFIGAYVILLFGLFCGGISMAVEIIKSKKSRQLRIKQFFSVRKNHHQNQFAL